MWHRIWRDLKIELYWMKKHLKRRWHLDTPVGVMGIIAILSGLALFVIIGQGLATMFRGAMPWVNGTNVSVVYWSSIWFAIKAGFVFLLFCSSLVFFFLFKMYYRRR